MCASHEGQYTFVIISHSVLIEMRNVSDESFTENLKTNLIANNFFPENRAVYEIMLKNIVQPGRPQMTTWSMRIGCWTPKATKTHS